MVVWVTLAILALCGYYGWRAGVLRRLLELAGVVLAIVLSARFAAAVAPWLGHRTAMSETTALLASYVLVFVGALILVSLLARTLTRLIHWTPLGWLDRLGGAICGVVLGALLVSIGLIAVSQAPRGEAVREAYLRQPAGQIIYQAAPSLYHSARRLFGGQMDDLWRRVVEVGGKIIEEAEKAAPDDS
jgi:membrane protein required for colicin V production